MELRDELLEDRRDMGEGADPDNARTDADWLISNHPLARNS